MANISQLSSLEPPNNYEKKYAGSTNQIVYQIAGEALKLYIPAFISITFNAIYQVNDEKLKSDIHCEVKLILNIKEISADKDVINHLKKNMYLYSSTEKPIHLDDSDEALQLQIEEDEQTDNKTNLPKYYYIKYTLTKTFVTGLEINALWTPFDTLGLTLSLNPKVKKPYYLNRQRNAMWYELGEKHLNEKHEFSLVQFHLNLMNGPSKNSSIKYQKHYKFSIYKIATQLIEAEFSSDVSSQRDINRSLEINSPNLEAQKKAADYSQIQEFQYAHFFISLYKNPLSVATTIFFPIILLSVINLGIFSQTNSLAGRIQNLAALMFAFMEIYPIVRSQIPPTPNLTLAQIHIFLITITTLICLINSIVIRGQGEAINVWDDTFFIISLAIVAYVLFAVIATTIVHFFYWQTHYYNKKEDKNKQSEDDDKNEENHEYWSNRNCNSHFMKFFDNQRIKPLKFLYDKKNQNQMMSSKMIPSWPQGYDSK